MFSTHQSSVAPWVTRCFPFMESDFMSFTRREPDKLPKNLLFYIQGRKYCLFLCRKTCLAAVFTLQIHFMDTKQNSQLPISYPTLQWKLTVMLKCTHNSEFPFGDSWSTFYPTLVFSILFYSWCKVYFDANALWYILYSYSTCSYYL